MSTDSILPLVAIGGAAYLLIDDSAGKVPGPTQYKNPTGQTIPQTMHAVSGQAAASLGAALQKQKQQRFSAILMAAANGPQVAFSNANGKTTSWESTSNTDPELAKKLDLVESYAKEQFENMDEVAKSKAADYLNKELKLDPPLTGKEGWSDVSKVVGGAAGGAACAAVGIGAAVAPLCAMAGAYLGEKLHDLIAENYEDAKKYLQEKWGDLKSELADAYNEVKDAISGLNPF